MSLKAPKDIRFQPIQNNFSKTAGSQSWFVGHYLMGLFFILDGYRDFWQSVWVVSSIHWTLSTPNWWSPVLLDVLSKAIG